MSAQIDLTGKKFGRLIALSYDKNKYKWRCLCECGNVVFVKSYHLRNSLICSCGCYSKEKTSINITKDLKGKRFGKLTVVKREGSLNGRATWLCHCDCGNDVILKSTNLLNYGTKSCGCLRSLTTKKRMSKNLIGKQFGYLKIIKRDDNSGKWICKCKCGKEILVKTSSLNNGKKTSCGCVNNFSITFRNNYYNRVFLDKWNEYVIPMFSQKQYINCQNIYNKIWKWKCVKCGQQFLSNIYSTGFNKQISNLPRCLKCYPHISGFSYKQKQVYNFVRSIYSGEIIENNRTIISPYQIDLYVSQKKIAIQFDGLYWHSSANVDNNYHLNKTQLCLQKGIQLIHIFEDEWIYKQEIVKDRIKSILGIDRKRIYARKCEIREISTKDKNIFLNQNHLQGQDNSKVKLGLYYQNQLISVMTFGKPRFNYNYEWQLIRFSSKLGCQVVGGASKLLKYFQKNYHPKNLISYADRRYSNGKLYDSIGFKLYNKSNPNYFYINGNLKISRYQCQKKQLKKLLGNNFDANLSEKENMLKNGYGIIYDCGNLSYILTQGN